MTGRPTLAVVGRGRAGGAFALALGQVGWRVPPPLRRGDDLARARDADVVLVAVPDGAIASVAQQLGRVHGALLHCSGATTLGALGGRARVGSVHPLASLPSPEEGAVRLLSGGWFAVAGDPVTELIVQDLGGRALHVPDADRTTYHAAAVIASNHLVALMGQVERVAATVGLPLDAFLDLAQGSLDNVRRLGPAAALTGPVARGDWVTVQRHVESLPEAERAGYEAMVELAVRLAGRTE